MRKKFRYAAAAVFVVLSYVFGWRMAMAAPASHSSLFYGLTAAALLCSLLALAIALPLRTSLPGKIVVGLVVLLTLMWVFQFCSGNVEEFLDNVWQHHQKT